MKKPGTRFEICKSGDLYWRVDFYIGNVRVAMRLSNKKGGDGWRPIGRAKVQANRWSAALPGNIPVVVKGK